MCERTDPTVASDPARQANHGQTGQEPKTSPHVQLAQVGGMDRSTRRQSKRPRYGRTSMMSRHRVFMTAFGFLILLAAIPGLSSAELTAHFVDVGQGGAVFIQKDGKNYIYDCGDTFAAKTFIEYLDDLDIKMIEALIVSHAHKDHMGACTAVLRAQQFRIK